MKQTLKTGLYIGTMSGTSADGLDIVIAKITATDQISQVSSYFAEYSAAIKNKVKQLQLKSSDSLFNDYKNELSALNSTLAKFFALHINKALKQAKINPKQIVAIGNHGQTILHQPNIHKPFSLQICDAQKLSNLCSVPVVANFRAADIKAGGQGAPLIPAFHSEIFKKYQPCAIINIGGIANTTLLNNDSDSSNENAIIGFDNGPGNTLMDTWAQQHIGKNYDDNGAWADSGKINSTLLDTLLDDKYFSLAPPKSTGQDYFNLEWLNSYIKHLSISPQDIQATLCELSAACIINDIIQFSNEHELNSLTLNSLTTLFICGGGVKNASLMKRLTQRAKKINASIVVHSTSKADIDPDWVEALGFAWLAFCYENNITANLPNVTGANKKVILGEKFNPAL